jgi:hypothetical protein
MKNIYKITKGQLISLWIFGLIGWGYTLDSYSDFGSFLSIFIPAILVFYTIGWRSYRNIKKPILNIDSSEVKSKVKKISKLFLPILIIVGILIFLGIVFYNKKEAKIERENYIGIFNRYEKNLENAKECMEQKNAPLVEVYTKECKVRYDKAYLSYKDCKKDMPWQSHNQCLNWFDSNYEAIDCSEETMLKKAGSVNQYICYADLKSDTDKINSYEEGLATKFLDSYPKTKATFSQSEIQKLYNVFPQEVFNDKTKERLNKFVESKGYIIEK